MFELWITLFYLTRIIFLVKKNFTGTDGVFVYLTKFIFLVNKKDEENYEHQNIPP